MMKPVLASSTGTGGDTVRRGFVHPTSSGAPTSGRTSMRRSNPPRERASAFICRGWTEDACRVSSKGSPKPTPTQPSASRARRRSEPSLGRDRLARECKLLGPSCLLPRTRPGREVVSRIQARVVQPKAFETVELLQEALGQALVPYWEKPARLRQLTGFSGWVEAVNAL